MSARFSSGMVIGMLALGLCAVPTGAEEFKASFPFELGRWYTIEREDGAVKLYRIRVEPQTGMRTFKSKLVRPTNSEFLQDVQIQLEYSNKASSDWKAKLRVVWTDEKGEPIDGYIGKESLGEDKKHELATMLLSTLKYGVLRAKKLEVEIDVEPD
jgi:hypothetical protein